MTRPFRRAAVLGLTAGLTLATFALDSAVGCESLASIKKNPDFKVLVPRDLHGRVSIFSSDLPWDQVVDGLLAPLGLISVLDADGLFVGRGPEASVRSQ